MSENPALVAASLRPVLAALNRRLRAQGAIGDLTRSQTNVLGRLEREGPSTANALARAEGVRPQSMSTTVAALVDQGLVIGTPHPGDRRKTLLALSDKAREMYARGRLAREDWLADRIEHVLTEDERAQIVTATELLRRIAES